MNSKIGLQLTACIGFFYCSMLWAQDNRISLVDAAAATPDESSTDSSGLTDEKRDDTAGAVDFAAATASSTERETDEARREDATAEANMEKTEAMKVTAEETVGGSDTNVIASESELETVSAETSASDTTQSDVPPRAEDEQQQGKSDSKKLSFLEKVAKKSERSIKVRIFTHYELSDEKDAPNHFELGMARLNLDWSHGRFLNAVLKYDFADLVNGEEAMDGLRDAYIRIEPIRWFGVQVGEFKKPFSRVELTSRKQLPVFSRGEANDYIVGFLQYGDRDLGLMVSGRLWKKWKLDYALGVFNGGGRSVAELGEGSKDVSFRLDSRPLKWLWVGASASARILRDKDLETVFDPSDYNYSDDVSDYPFWLSYDDPEDQMAGFIADYPWLTGTHWMGELDAKVKFSHFEAVVEGMIGENWWFEESPYIWSITTILSAPFPVAGGRMKIEPALMAEVMSIEHESWTWRARMFEVSPGVNLHFGDDFRIMVHGRWNRTQGEESDFDEAPLRGFWPGEWPGSFADSTSLFVQLAYAN
ncbi:MAG: hypothetical protein JXX29_15670 [Deltaproteobacteria bacterium]|nr:hypothetical protein [Deltaproteobacteria bacterium]MBN2673119.1 hypothetical protein [Deltaproteobacteria bacterium]